MSKPCLTLSADFNPDEARKQLMASNMTAEMKALFSTIIEVVLFFSLELDKKNVSLRRLRRMIFSTSEKLRDLPNKDATSAGKDSAPAEPAPAPAAPPPPSESPAATDQPKPKGHGRNSAFDVPGATENHVPHPTLKHGDRCPDCMSGNVYTVNPTVSIRLYGNAPIGAVRTVGEQFRCGACGETFAADVGSDCAAPKYDVCASAIVPLLKYGAGMPFNRLEGLQRCAGVPVAASVQWKLCNEGAETLMPVFNELAVMAAQCDVVHIDDTTARMIGAVPRNHKPTSEKTDRPEGRSGTFTTSVVAKLSGGINIALFMTGWKHAGENLTDVLARRSACLNAPIQMSDALSRNMPDGLKTILANCLTHARREFVDIVDVFPDACRHVIAQLAIVYQNDATARAENMSPEARLAYHQARSGPVMDALKTWLSQQIDGKLVEPNSSLGKAISYMRKHWDKLTAFLRHAGAPLCNNICERALKMAILNRKNAFFYRTPRGALVADVFMSLIHTARLAGKNVLHYLVACLEHPADVAANPQSWMPWNYERALETVVPLAA